MSEKQVDLVVDALAVFRLTKLVTDDKITEDLREWVFKRYGDPSVPDAHKLSYFLQCPWCVSIYAGTAVTLARIMAPRAWSVAARALALSAATGLLAERGE